MSAHGSQAIPPQDRHTPVSGIIEPGHTSSGHEPSAEGTLIARRIAELAAVSARPDALERVHLSLEHSAVNACVGTWFAEAGLEVRIDAAGNLCGRIEGREPGLPALLLGSHLDTVPDAGRYDGMLGVLLALAAIRRLAAQARSLPFALELVALSDEEGTRFGTALSGSRALAGTFDPAWWDIQDGDGATYREAALAFGLDPARIGEAARAPHELVGYLEAHIEQGPELLDQDRPLGVVSSIGAATRSRITLTGRAGHAGGTPWPRRRDALVAASEVILAIESIARDAGALATVGTIQVLPGGVNVIPGIAEFSLDLRAESTELRAATFERILDATREICERRRVIFECTETYRADAVTCAPALRAAVETGIARATAAPVPAPIWSRAGHDGLAIATITDVAMLFVRCGNEGISHHPDESVLDADIEVALEALTAAIQAFAEEYAR
ncbi:allantoate amidohydrolase [Mycetocola sp. JXN-3]|uniref:allantoate amidohydrolase n=1 Tax=Mycetocola sp. JXN-3 TaxID=2116510 RepID=UPI00165D189D|nr:allantoate amidohydrolase [Mycetocola sp. JXN-3]